MYPLVNTCYIPERFRDEQLIIQRYVNLRLRRVSPSSVFRCRQMTETQYAHVC